MLNTILSIVGWVGTLLVFAGVAIRLFRPQWDQYAYWAAIAGLVCVGLYTLSQWREIVRSFQKRETKLGAMTSVSVIAVLAILIGLNYLVNRRDKRWDLTAAGSYTLSDQTTKVLSNLETPVKAVVFDQPGSFQRFRDAFGPYEYASRNIQVEYVDADRQPARVKEYNVTNYGTVVLEHAGRRETVMSDREQDLTNALIKVTTGRQIKAYFVEGHGEKEFSGSGRTGYSSVVDLLKRDNYTVDKIVLAQAQGGVPADASVVIVGGPTSDYLKPEVDAIRTYLRKGGKALFLLDPPSATISAACADARSVIEGVGHHDGSRRRDRHQRHGPVARDRCVSPCRRDLSASPGDRKLQSADRLSALAIREGRSRRRAWNGEYAESHSDERAKLVRIRCEISHLRR